MFDHATSDYRDGMPFLGGWLWIDLVNSKNGALGDLIETPEGWQRWAAAAGLAIAADKAALAPEAAAMRELRTALARIFEALYAREEPAPEAVMLVNRYLEEGASYTRIEFVDGEPMAQEALLNGDSAAITVARDFAAFLGKYNPDRLRHCANDDCTLVFSDTSKNGARRWCSMEVCGNRHKVRSHRARKGAPR